MSTTKMANLWNSKKSILDITDNGESDTESVFSGDSNDSDSEVEDGDNDNYDHNNMNDDVESNDTDNSLPSTDGWSKYRS